MGLNFLKKGHKKAPGYLWRAKDLPMAHDACATDNLLVANVMAHMKVAQILLVTHELVPHR